MEEVLRGSVLEEADNDYILCFFASNARWLLAKFENAIHAVLFSENPSDDILALRLTCDLVPLYGLEHERGSGPYLLDEFDPGALSWGRGCKRFIFAVN